MSLDEVMKEMTPSMLEINCTPLKSGSSFRIF